MAIAVFVAASSITAVVHAQSGPVVYPSQPDQTQPGGLTNPQWAFDPNNQVSQASGAVSVMCTARTASPKIIETTWFGVPTGYSPTTLTVKWGGGAYGAIMQGATKVEVELLYSLDGGDPTTPFPASGGYLSGYWSKSNMTYQSCQSGGANYPCSFTGFSRITLSPTQDTSLIRVKAKLTATLVSCGNQIDGTNATGSIAVADIRIETACTVPTGETSTVIGWNSMFPTMSIAQFRGHLIAANGANFTGRLIKEEGDPDGYDACIPDSDAELLTPLEPWVVAADNTYAPDNIGVNNLYIAYHQQALHAPCSATQTQHMLISCGDPSTFVRYAANPVGYTVDVTTFEVTRANQTLPKPFP